MRSVTTVDMTDAGKAIARRADRYGAALSRVDWRHITLAVLLFMPLTLGRGAGTVARIAARVVVLVAAASVEGWNAGYRPSTQRRSEG